MSGLSSVRTLDREPSEPVSMPQPFSGESGSTLATLGKPSSNEDAAAMARMASRASAASVSESEIQSLLSERQSLIDKKLANTLTRQEANRLQLVLWSLDRIEDAHFGVKLDAYEEAIKMQERLASQIGDLKDALWQATEKKGRRR
jgi:hypothetical protein